jgi:hypothetical protein
VSSTGKLIQNALNRASREGVSRAPRKRSILRRKTHKSYKREASHSALREKVSRMGAQETPIERFQAAETTKWRVI